MSSALEPTEELLELTRSLHAYAEWVQVVGSHGLPEASAEDRAARDEPSPHTLEAVEPPPPATPPPREQSAAPDIPKPPPRAAAPKEPAPKEFGPREPAPKEPASAQPEPARDTAALRVRLNDLAARVAQCAACPLHSTRTQTVFERGTLDTGLCFVGEAPGEDEDAQGKPFVGKAGQLLDRMIAAMGFEREQVYICNIVKCRPPNNRKPTPEEMAACMPFLLEQLEIVGPQVMVALGATAVRGLLDTRASITRLRGTWKLFQGKIAVMPTFHPAYLLRSPHAKREVWADLQAVLRHMGRSVPQQK